MKFLILILFPVVGLADPLALSNLKSFIQISTVRLEKGSLDDTDRFYIGARIEGAHFKRSTTDWDYKILSSSWYTPKFSASDLNGKKSKLQIPVSQLKNFIEKNQSDAPWELCIDWFRKTGLMGRESLHAKCIKFDSLPTEDQNLSITMIDNYDYTHPRLHYRTNAMLAVDVKITD